MANYDPVHRDDAILWARKILENRDNYVIWDTETTGLSDDDEIVQIAIIDLNRTVLINSLVKPAEKKSIPRRATEIHGIKKSDLKNAPLFCDLMGSVQTSINNKKVIIYNAEYDIRLLKQTCWANSCKPLNIQCECAMKHYSKYIGEWNDRFNDYKYQKLRGGDHSALGDCYATLDTISRMAKSKIEYTTPEMINSNKPEAQSPEMTVQKKWWQFWK